jgi:AraC-like DNA-binding protein
MGARLIGMVDLPAGTRLIRLLECLLELSRCEQALPLASVGFSSSSDFPAASRAERICAYIAEHYCDPELSHQQLALQAEMNPSAFSRFFREATGKTVMNYLAEMRISLACRLLMQTDQPVSEIYRSCGFSHASNFNRQFHRLRRVSAREFRKQHRASVGSLPPAAPDLALQ